MQPSREGQCKRCDRALCWQQLGSLPKMEFGAFYNGTEPELVHFAIYTSSLFSIILKEKFSSASFPFTSVVMCYLKFLRKIRLQCITNVCANICSSSVRHAASGLHVVCQLRLEDYQVLDHVSAPGWLDNGIDQAYGNLQSMATGHILCNPSLCYKWEFCKSTGTIVLLCSSHLC